MISVKKLRDTKLQSTPVIYKWWFKQAAAKGLISLLLPHIQIGKIEQKTVGKDTYWLLYVGKAINCNQRLVEYHILDKNKFHYTGVENGRLSSLRQTICGLKGWKMNTAKELVDEFIDDNCMVEYFETERSELEKIEKVFITACYPVLNSKNTFQFFTKEHRKILSQRKKEFKN